MSATTLERRRRRAAARWAALLASPRPVVYIGMGSCGLAAGAGEVYAAVRAHLDERGIDAEIVSVGCIGPCYLEPLLDVQLPGRTRLSYSNMTAELAVKTLDALLAGELPKRHLRRALRPARRQRPSRRRPLRRRRRSLRRRQTAERWPAPTRRGFAELPRFADHAMLKDQVRIVLRNCGVIDPEQLDHYLARGGYRAFESCLGSPGATSSRRSSLGPARARRRRLSHLAEVVEVPRDRRRRAQPHLQRRRGRPRRLHEPLADRGRPARPARGHADRRLRDRRGARLHLHQGGVPAGRPPSALGDRGDGASSACSASTSWAPTSRSTSRSRRARGPSSAARRRP